MITPKRLDIIELLSVIVQSGIGTTNFHNLFYCKDSRKVNRDMKNVETSFILICTFHPKSHDIIVN